MDKFNRNRAKQQTEDLAKSRQRTLAQKVSKTPNAGIDLEVQREKQAASAYDAKLLNQLNQQYELYYKALQQKGQSVASSTSYNNLINSMPIIPSRPVTPMNPPKFEVGYKVTVRSGKTVMDIHRVEPYNSSYIYIIVDPKTGNSYNEQENDLHLVETNEGPKIVVEFDSVIIADEKRQQILEALEQINQADLIFDKWGFGETIEKGKGVSMLFYGPPGTGKTLMAQAIAHKLDYKLKIISTADVESSAPGEAERNIRKHFKDAKGGKTILLFDECDSLIYTRTNVGPILGAQINELLSQIERFDGITLFTTNRLGTLDEAVNRRLALKLEFDMPSQSERSQIWQRMFPKACPLASDIDWMILAEIEITGGYIKNAVLRAARMAAIEKIPDDKKQIKMVHLLKALKFEAESMVDFQNARDDHEKGIGHVTINNNGQRTVERGRTRG